MITARTVLDQIEITRIGGIQLRFGLLLEENGIELDCKWHRTAVEPGGDIVAQFGAVNAHLAQMGKVPISHDTMLIVQAHAAVAWTEDVLMAYTGRANPVLSAPIIQKV